MKKMFFVIVTFFCVTQIVKASDIKDATLKDQGKQNEASTIAWLKSANPESGLITMTLTQFNAGFKACIVEFNSKYKTFDVVTNDVLSDKVVPQLYTAELDPEKLYTLSYWDVTTQKWGRWNRKPKKGETGLFYPGWEEPVLSVYCWNFSYPSAQKVTAPVQKVEKPEKEYTYIPGKTVIIEHGVDSVIERFYSYKETEKNFFEKNINNTVSMTRNNSQSYDVDMNKKAVERQTDDHYEEASYKEEAQECKQPSKCNHKKVKNKNGFWTHALAFGVGLVTGAVLENNTNVDFRRNVPGRRIITQGPYVPLPSTPAVYTQAPMYQ
jgi:hypothetical protein